MTVFEREVTVVGAGPAGAVCASYLAKAGVDVLLLEKDVFPREKPCGDILREGFVYHMEALGAARAVDAMSTCVRNLRLISDGGSTTTIPFECYCVPRHDVDRLLADTAVSLGAELRQGCTVTGVTTDRGRVTGVKAIYRGEEIRIRSRLVIGADGAFSATAKVAGVMKESPYGMWIGERAYFEGVELDRSLAKGQYDAYGVFGFEREPGTGYLWVMPVGREGVAKGICNVGVMVRGRDDYERLDLRQCVSRWIDKHPEISTMFGRAVRVSPWQGGRMNDVSCGTGVTADGLMMIGDAAGLVMPLSNDGMTAAADSARAAAEAAVDALTSGHVSRERLAASYGKHFRFKDVAGAKRATDQKPVGAWDTAMTMGGKPLTEALKEKRLLMESMKDPATMDRVIELLETDPVYRRRHLG